MPIVQNKYSHSHFLSGKTEVGAVNSLPKVSQQVAEAEFEFGSSDNMTLPLGKKFKNKREQWWEQAKSNALEWRRKSIWQL